MPSATFDRTPVADPSELGLDPDAIDALFARVQQDVDAGRLPSCQVAFGARRQGRRLARVRRRARRVAVRDLLGDEGRRRGRGMGPDRRGTPRHHASRRGDRPGVRGKRQGRDHRRAGDAPHVGFPRAPFGPLEWDDREQRLARFASWRCNWEPGSRYEYHPTSAHWVLAEIIERCTGADFRAFVREQILDPLGLTAFQVGAPPAEQSDINVLVATGEHATADELEAAIGVRSLPLSEVTTESLLTFNQPDVRAVGVPGAGGVSTAADLALYYQALLTDPTGIWRPEVLADVTAHVRNHMPDYMGTPANRSLGLVIAGDDGRSAARGMGHTVSARAFGHNGAGGQIAWADPETGLSFCYLTNGLDQHELREWRRTSGIASRAAKCVSR